MHIMCFVATVLQLQLVTAENIGATELLNYTEDTLDMHHYVQNMEDLSQCCNYSYQILDKFCAKQALVRVFYNDYA